MAGFQVAAPESTSLARHHAAALGQDWVSSPRAGAQTLWVSDVDRSPLNFDAVDPCNACAVAVHSGPAQNSECSSFLFEAKREVEHGSRMHLSSLSMRQLCLSMYAGSGLGGSHRGVKFFISNIHHCLIRGPRGHMNHKDPANHGFWNPQTVGSLCLFSLWSFDYVPTTWGGGSASWFQPR